MDVRRSERLASALRDELEEILNYELDDPRVGAIAIEEVILSPDGKKVLVRITSEGRAQDQSDTLRTLRHASRHIRGLLSERLDVYRVPEVNFEAALAPELSEKKTSLMRRVRRGRPKE